MRQKTKMHNRVDHLNRIMLVVLRRIGIQESLPLHHEEELSHCRGQVPTHFAAQMLIPFVSFFSKTPESGALRSKPAAYAPWQTE
jgi:hypothetical protein